MKQILLVDDSKFQRTANLRLLTNAGYEVAVAGDGEEALALILHKTPDLILLDLMLPKMSGLDVLRHLKKSARTASIPVIVMSGLSDKNGAKLLKEGAAVYLEKSKLESVLSADSFLRMVQDVLAKYPCPC